MDVHKYRIDYHLEFKLHNIQATCRHKQLCADIYFGLLVLEQSGLIATDSTHLAARYTMCCYAVLSLYT